MATIADQKFVFFGQGGLSASEGEGAHLIVHAAKSKRSTRHPANVSTVNNEQPLLVMTTTTK